MSDGAKEFSERWGVNIRTVKNWLQKGEECGVAPPLGADDPEEFLEWFRVHYDREPVQAVKDAAREMREERGEFMEEPVEVDLSDVVVLKSILRKLGLDLNLARIIEEEERAFAEYDYKRARGFKLDSALKRWKEAGEIKRKLQSSPDVVNLALELLKAWLKEEFEVRERETRERLNGERMGRESRALLMACSTDAEFVKVWNKCLTKALRPEEEGGEDD